MIERANATRQVYWNVSHSWLMYLLFLLAVSVAAWGLYRRLALWRRGKAEDRLDRPMERLQMLLRHALLQGRTLTKSDTAVFHTLIYVGFIVLTLATTVVMIEADLGISIMHGPFYLYFQSFAVDVFGLFTLIGVGVAMMRRFIAKPRKLVCTSEAGLLLLLIFVICATGFLLEGWRIAATNDPWAAWSPAGNLVAHLSKYIMGHGALQTAHAVTWWFHAVLVFGLIAWAPYTKLLHVLTAPLNIYTASLRPAGAVLNPIDFDTAEVLGSKSLSQFTWKGLLDLDACTECGRCTESCPANALGKSLSPCDIILGLRDLARHDFRAFGLNQGDVYSSGDGTPSGGSFAIAGAVAATAPEALWACTTCGACVQVCPVFIEQMPKIVDMRRYLVMETAEYPATMQEAISSMDTRGHPFRGTQFTRLDWAQGLGVRTAAEAPDFEVLLWVGCSGALVERNQKITRATAELLHVAGVNFAVLGSEEKCTGDLARRIGDEFLFQKLARRNIETLRRYNVRKIVTTCPHCFNTLANEYPQVGGEFEVLHHTEFLAKLVEEGRLKPGGKSDHKITYHDPCYLARHNVVVEAPRRLVQSTSRVEILEMKQSRQYAFCCGGGGGMSFVDEPGDKRVNQERAAQALATGSDVVAVSCPFCLTMLEDGINARQGDREVRVMDVAELLLRSIKDGEHDSNN